MRQTRRNGFTLLELLVVVIIVGILASVAIPQFRRVTDRARETEAQNILNSVMTAEMAFFQENGTFTVNPAQLLITIPGMHDWSIPAFAAGNTTAVALDGVAGGTLANGVTITVNGTAAPVLGLGGHTHAGHTVTGVAVSTGARRIDTAGAF